MSNMKIAIIVIAFNRPARLKNLLDKLIPQCINLELPVYINIDGPKLKNDSLVDYTVKTALDYTNEFNVFLQSNHENLGCRSSVIKAIDNAFKNYDAVIVIEDDLIISNDFILFMTHSLSFYKDYNDVGSISGYSLKLPVTSNYTNYFLHRPSSWGWATWRDRWESAIWNYDQVLSDSYANVNDKMGQDFLRMFNKQRKNKISSWAVDWGMSHHLNNWVTVVPWISKVENNGFGADATHCSTLRNPYPSSFSNEAIYEEYVFDSNPKIDQSNLKQFLHYYSNLYKIQFKTKDFLLKHLKNVTIYPENNSKST